MVKEITLTRGAVAIVDDADYDYLSQFKWYMSSHGYARTCRTVARKEISMHRLVIGAKDGELVDHINHNKLDNRKSNLRICTRSENQMNRKAIKGASAYKGVFKSLSAEKPWKAVISFGGKRVNLGQYPTEVEAAFAYDLAAKEYHKEFACINGVHVSNFISTKREEPTSKQRGVHWHRSAQKWVASIVIEGKQKHIGSFRTEQEAVGARLAAEISKQIGRVY